ncbi:MAG: class I SAM-dependent methyltransferase [Verrucomicrobia bacterium]|nr:class I SAM-dependent methyltransferase [Verrucomicrobiota bacterium]
MTTGATPFGEEDLRQIYKRRFETAQAYRNEVWKVLTARFFQRYVSGSAAVLDLGCGYGEFINHIRCAEKHAMDLNPDGPRFLAKDVRFLHQNCAQPWQLSDASLEVVFTSNFFEHLPDKSALARTLAEAWRCLKPGGHIICMGPNIRYLPGRYWDFWDHHLPLTDLSLKEGLETAGFSVTTCLSRFLPYTMVNAPRYPISLVALYLRCPPLWKLLGRQFLVIARK